MKWYEFLAFVFLMGGLVIPLITPVYAQDVYIYVDELPAWANYAGDVMYLSTEAWAEANDGLQFYSVESPSDADFQVKWVKEFGGDHVGYAYGDQFIEVGLGDSNCGNQWNPYSEKHISDIMTHEIGHVFGHEHNDDPDSIMYPISLNLEYGIIEEEYRLTEGYGQFVQFCTIKDLTSFEFNISTTDETYGFDYYIVPSHDEFEKWVDGKTFQYYSNDDCFGEEWLSISGTCNGISAGSGLMILMDDKLTTPLEIITVTQLEKPDIAYYKSTTYSKLPETSITNFRDEYIPPTIKEDKTIVDLKQKIRDLKLENHDLKQQITALNNDLEQFKELIINGLKEIYNWKLNNS